MAKKLSKELQMDIKYESPNLFRFFYEKKERENANHVDLRNDNAILFTPVSKRTSNN